MARIVSVTSGKGGVGKTNISVNLALHLAQQGYRVCLFDADLGLANVDILLGLFPDHTLADVISGERGLGDVLIKDCRGIDIVPGSSGVDRLADLETQQRERLIEELGPLEAYDFIFFDTSAGISRNVIAFCMASPEVLLVVTPEPTSITDGYALLKVLSLNGFDGGISVLVNQIDSVEKSRVVYNKFKAVVGKYLPITITPAGTVVTDHAVRDAVGTQEPFILRHPESSASKCIRNIGRSLLQDDREHLVTRADGDFWATCLDVMGGPMVLNDADPKIKPDAERQQLREPIGETSHTEPAEEKTGDDIKHLLVSLEKHISAISRDMTAIRKHLELTGSTPDRS